jgi:hypothetical protein
MTVLLVLMAVLVVSCSLVVLSLCVSASRGDELVVRHLLERWERDGSIGAALRFESGVTGEAQRDQVRRSVAAARNSRYDVMGCESPFPGAALHARAISGDDLAR